MEAQQQDVGPSPAEAPVAPADTPDGAPAPLVPAADAARSEVPAADVDLASVVTQAAALAAEAQPPVAGSMPEGVTGADVTTAAPAVIVTGPGRPRFSLVQVLRDTPLAFVDVETTGASAEWGDRVIELGIVRVEGGKVVGEYQQLIDPQRRISPGVTALTGISQAMVTGQPTFGDQCRAATDLLGGAVVLGHNVRFDLSFLRKEFRRCGRDITEVLGDVPVLDTVRIARRRFGRGGNALQNLARRLGCQPAVAHRALADAQTTHYVFERLMEPVGGWGMCLCDAIREQGGPMGLLPIAARESLLPLELEEALEQRCTVMMEYLDARQKRTQRVIEPLQVRRSNGELTLVAHCHLRNDRRTFKLDRIVQFVRIEAGAGAENVGSAGA